MSAPISNSATSASRPRWAARRRRGPSPGAGVRLDVQHHRLPGRRPQPGPGGPARPCATRRSALDVADRRGARTMTQKSRLTSSSEKRDVLVGLGLDLQLHLSSSQARGQHDLLGDDGRLPASPSPPGGLGAALGDHAAHASATSSNFSIWPSVIQPFSNGSEAQSSSTYSPDAVWPLDQLTLDELMSQSDHRRMLSAQQGPETHGGGLPRRPNTPGLLISYFNASSKALVRQEKRRSRTAVCRCKIL